MAEVRNLDDLIPQDIEYHFRGETLTLPGDIDTKRTYAMLRLLQRQDELLAAAKAGNDNLDEREKVDTEVEVVLLELFQERHPELEKLPFGVKALQHVLMDILIALGFEFVVAAGDADPPTRTPSVKTRSRRSNSSKRSSKSTASATKKS